MLKVRLMGTKNDIVWFQKILQRHPKIEVLEISELYSNKGTSKYYRAYAEVQKNYALQRMRAKTTSEIRKKHMQNLWRSGRIPGRRRRM